MDFAFVGQPCGKQSHDQTDGDSQSRLKMPRPGWLDGKARTPDQEGAADQQGRHQRQGTEHSRQRGAGQHPVPGAGVNIHPQHGEDFAITFVGPGTDDQIIQALDIGCLVVMLSVDGVLVFKFHPAAAFGLSDLLDLPAEILPTGPIFLVDPVLADQFRFYRMGQPSHVAVVSEGVEVALVEFSPRIVDFLQEALPSVLLVEFHRPAHHPPGVFGGSQAVHDGLRIKDGDQRRDPLAPAVGVRPLDEFCSGTKGAAATLRRLGINLPGRGVVLRCGRFAVHEEIERAVCFTPEEVGKPAERIGRTHRSELFLDPLVMRAGQVRLRARERLEVFEIHRLRNQPRLLEEFSPDITGGTQNRPPGKYHHRQRKSQQQHRRQARDFHAVRTDGRLITHRGRRFLTSGKASQITFIYRRISRLCRYEILPLFLLLAALAETGHHFALTKFACIQPPERPASRMRLF